MARSITLTLGAGLGGDLGPNFNLTADIGSVTPSTATKTELLAGKSVSVDDTASLVTVTSTGSCTNFIVQSIPCITTTSTTTTAYPSTSGQNFYKIAVSRDEVVTSNDGKYVITGRTGANILRISNNYGTAFRTITMPFSSGNGTASVGVSGTGQYMYVVETNTSANKWVWRSQDYGVTWLKVPTWTTPRAWSSLSVSRTGQYVMATSTNVNEVYPGSDSAYWFKTSQYWLSTDYGVSFSRISYAGGNFFLSGSAISSNGQYQLLVNPNDITDFDSASYISQNYGSTFLKKNITGAVTYYDCSMSSDGNKQVIAGAGGTYVWPQGLTNTFLIKSSDNGETWTTFGTTQKKWYNVAMEGTGTNLIAITYGADYLYRSTNFGTVTAITGPGSRTWGNVAMSYTGYAYATETTGIWRSTDSGASWTKLS